MKLWKVHEKFSHTQSIKNVSLGLFQTFIMAKNKRSFKRKRRGIIFSLDSQG